MAEQNIPDRHTDEHGLWGEVAVVAEIPAEVRQRRVRCPATNGVKDVGHPLLAWDKARSSLALAYLLLSLWCRRSSTHQAAQPRSRAMRSQA